MQGALQLLWVDRVVSDPLFVNLLDDGLSCCLARWLENNFLENLEPLIFQLSNGLHFYVVPIEILKEESHPLDHDLMVCPPLVEFSEELLSRCVFKIFFDVGLQVVFDGLRILGIKNLLSLVVLDCAEIIHDPIGTQIQN